MPSDWVSLSGVVTNLSASSKDIGYRYAPYVKFAGKSAAGILKQVDTVLQASNAVLDNHKGSIPAEEYAELKQTYHRYHWQMVDESQEFRATTDALIRQSRILSQVYANRSRDSQEKSARNLLRQVEAYYTTVLSASSKATPSALRPFEDELSGSSAAPSQSISSGSSSSRSSYMSLFSVFGGSASSCSTSIDPHMHATTPEPEPEPEPESAPTQDAQAPRLTITITYLPVSSTELAEVEIEGSRQVVGTGSNIFRRIITFEDGDQRIEVKGDKLYALNPNEAYIDKTTMQSLSELGHRLLNQSAAGTAQGPQIDDSMSQSETLEAAVEKFKKLPVVPTE